MARRSFRCDHRGQVLVVSALLVALLLLSTAIYVIEVGKEVPKVEVTQSANFERYKPSVRNAMISALANASNGGDPDVLALNLAELRAVMFAHSYRVMLNMEYNTFNEGGYDNGIWIYWGNTGEGVSSAYASYAFSSSSSSCSSEFAYAVNVTSQMHVSGSYVQLNDTLKQVNLTVDVLNEATPALARDFTFRYLNELDWVLADEPSVVSYGNGTYAVYFGAETGQLGEPFNVSTTCLDQRGIFIGANVTCYQV